MNKFLLGLISSGTWLAMTASHVSRNEIEWTAHMPELLTSFLFGALGFSFVFFVLFFKEERNMQTQGHAIVRDVGIRIILLLVGVLLIIAASYLLYLAGQ